MPLLAFRSSFPLTVGTVNRENGQTIYRMWCRSEDVGKQFDYYVFDWPSQVTPGNYGLKVRNAQNVLVFDSTMKWLRVAALIQAGSASSSGTAPGAPAGRICAIVPSNQAYIWTNTQLGGTDPQGNTTWVLNSYSQGFYNTADGIGWASVRGFQGQQIKAQAIPPPTSYNTGSGSAMLIDVTGY